MSRRELPVVRVANPCTVDWETMTGDDRVRFCGECRKNVYDLSVMEGDEAIAFVKAREGIATCVTFIPRADGTFATSDCARGAASGSLGTARRALARGAVLAAALAAVATAGCEPRIQRDPTHDPPNARTPERVPSEPGLTMTKYDPPAPAKPVLCTVRPRYPRTAGVMAIPSRSIP